MVAMAGGLLLAVSGCASRPSQIVGRPLPYFFQVDEHLYRGAQPTVEGFHQLQAMGVKTVVSLRAHQPNDAAFQQEQDLVESLGMRWVSLPTRMYWKPSETQVRAFLELALDPAQQPVFLHCQRGEDRTGSLVAIYRIVKQGWLPERAYQEALALGMAGWNRFTRSLILHKTEQAFL